MKIAGAVFADFVETTLGGAAALRSELAGLPLLTRTLRRLCRVAGVCHRCLVVRPDQQELGTAALAAAGVADQVTLLPKLTPAWGRSGLVRSARKWNLESWRSGPLGLTWFDEFINPAAVQHVLDHCQCEATLCLEGHQALFDPALAGAMVRHLQEQERHATYCFTQAPPGLAGIVVSRVCLEDVAQLGIPLGLLTSYRPEIPRADPITSANCAPVPLHVMQTAARLNGDTRRGRELMTAAIEALGEDADVASLCRWVRDPGHGRAGPLPVEVELELTTDDPLPQTTLRPRGDRVPRRQLEDLDAVARLAEELAAYDDRLVFLGGHGDPLQHPQFGEVCRLLREGGVFGIGLATPLVDLRDEHIEVLLGQQIDVIEVRLDAFSAATYQRVHGRDAYQQAVQNVRRLEEIRRERRSPQPVCVPSLTRCEATITEMEPFYDHWINAVGSAVLSGFNNYCGALPADSLLPTCPPERVPCRRLDRRLMLHGDGGVPLCGQDYAGTMLLGDWRRERLAAVWTGAGLAEVRANHAKPELGSLPLCQRCEEWFRP